MEKLNQLEVSFFDRHAHARRYPLAEQMIPVITKHAWGAVAMPNTQPNLKTSKEADRYLREIERISPVDFEWIGTCYLTDNTDPDDLALGFKLGIWKAAKLYPAGMTTNSDEAVTSISKIEKVLERAAQIQMPILVHGEHASKEIHPEYAEKKFMDEKLPELADSGAPIIIEHVSFCETAWMVAERKYKNVIGATLAPQHLAFDSRDEKQSTRFEKGFKRGTRPKFICMPPLKMPGHNMEIMRAVGAASELFGAGTDIAGHFKPAKYCDLGACGCATPRPVELYATAFDDAGLLRLLPSFLGINLLEWYGLKPRQADLRLTRESCGDESPIGGGEFEVESLTSGMTLPWHCVKI